MKFWLLLLVLSLSSCLQKNLNTIKEKLGLAPKAQLQEEILNIQMPSLNEVWALEDAPVAKEVTAYDKLSPEQKQKYQIAFIKEMMWEIRRVPATDNDYQNYLNMLIQGGTREGIINGLMVDNYYRGLEEQKQAVISPTIDFTKQFMAQFLAQKFKDDLLFDVNVYRLKRIMSEKVFSLLDKMQGQKDYQESWYALFSQKMAQDYPELWQNQLRKNTDPVFHYQWAQSMPSGHIKSEVIIKLHRVLNHLNKI